MVLWLIDGVKGLSCYTIIALVIHASLIVPIFPIDHNFNYSFVCLRVGKRELICRIGYLFAGFSYVPTTKQ